jgi:cytochrome P450
VKLQKEIDDACREGRLTFSTDGIAKIGYASRELSLLEGTLRESMRLHPVVGVPFPRVVGQEGMLVDDVLIPGGVSVPLSISSNHAPNEMFV